MTDSARHILHVVALREDLPLDGWEHYYTGMSDTGESVFLYDRTDGRQLRVTVTAEGYQAEVRA